jgi:glycosyltransferase involved in cell wall biosynthesis
MVAGRLPIPPLDGGTMRFFNLARRWKEDFELTLVAPTYEPVSEELQTQMGDEMGTVIHPVPIVLRSKSHRILSSLRTFTRSIPQVDLLPEVAAYLRNLLVTQPFDVVQFEGSGGGNYLPLVQAVGTRPRTILVFYDVMWDWWRREFFATPRPVALFRWLLYRYWEPKFAASADACIFLSEVDRKRVESQAYLRQFRIVPNGIIGNEDIGIDPPAGDLPQTQDVLFVGSFNHLPNIQAAYWLITHIWPVLQEQIPHCHLTIAGRNPPEALNALARNAGIEIIGNAPDLTPYYRRCRVVIVPIQSGGGIRVKILEAFAQGRPIVTTTIGAEGLPLVPGKHVLFADTSIDLAAAVQRLIEDDLLAKSLVIQGRKLVESEFNWDILAKRQSEVFEQDDQ